MRRCWSQLLIGTFVTDGLGVAPVISHGATRPFLEQNSAARFFESVLPEPLPPLKYPAWSKPIDRARLEAFQGRYKLALLTLTTVADAENVEVALIRAKALAAMGQRSRALDILSADGIENDFRARTARAQILIDVARYSDALALLEKVLAAHPDSLTAHYLRGVASEASGDLEAARGAYAWFVDGPDSPFSKWQRDRERAIDDPEQVVTIGRAVDRWAVLTGSFQSLPKLHDELLDLFVRAYDVVDRGYWPAHVAAAEYFLAHDNSDKAGEELKAALTANPNDLSARALAARIAISTWNFDGADQNIAAIREVDPTSIAADLLEARNLLAQRRPIDAEAVVRRVVDRIPNHLEALGLLAATYALRLDEPHMRDVLARVEKIDPDNASAYFEVAEQLGAMRQYPRSIAMYKVALDRAPWWTEAHNGLGLLYTQSGDEDDAKATLDVAHAIDPYNLRTTNYLRLLEDLSKFARKETDHFIVMYDGKLDPMIPEYFGDYLESIHASVCAEFRVEPPVKTYIEVFPTHDAFSVRTTGSPWIGTVGASTGRVIAMVAPRQGEATMGPFNWANVLRHEYTHTVTLAATDNRIGHWMTEGLAVYQEHTPLKWEWVPLLYDAVTNDKLFPLDQLTWGFVRPKRPTDRSLAYAQSFWICKLIEDRYGHEAIMRMLAACRDGADERTAIEAAVKKSESEFQSEFFAWAKDQVSQWGYDPATSEKYEALREQGEAQIKARKFGDAVQTWEQIAAIRPLDQLPHQRLAGLYLTKEVNQPMKAVEQLEKLDAVELKDNRYAKRIAQILRDANDLSTAQKYALQAVYTNPYDLGAHKLLLEISERNGDESTASRERRVVPILEAWTEKSRAAGQVEDR